jgi:ribosomal protein L16 Arg81 hydroxylase
MLINPFDFDALISPITQQEFFNRYWEKEPLLLTERGADGYRDLISFKDMDYLLSSLTDPRHWTRFINNKKAIDVEKYLKQDALVGVRNTLDMQRVVADFKAGTTILLEHLHHRWEPVRQLCATIENAVGGIVGCTSILTPSSAQGFQAHYDAYNVFVLQIEGEKLWKIYDSHIPYPIGYEDVPFVEPLAPPIYEVWLEPGDFLYIPRGHVHEALTAKNYSLHLSVAVGAVTWADVIEQIAKDEPMLRRLLPKEALLQGKTVSAEDPAFKSFRMNSENIKKALDKLRVSIGSRRAPSHHGHLTSFDLEGRLSENTLLKKREEKVFSVAVLNDGVSLKFKKGSLQFAPQFLPALQHILQEPKFSIQTLPNTLSNEEKHACVRRLIEAYVLVEA